MSEIPYNEDDVSRFAVAFMKAVIAWNNAENAARNILVAFGGNSIGLRIASEHLGARAMKEALLTLCDTLSSAGTERTKETADHIAHFLEGLDTLRAYRNFYVHSLRSTGWLSKDPKTYLGFLSATEAKGRLAFVKHELTIRDLEEFMAQTVVCQAYGEQLSRCIPREWGAKNALAQIVESKPQPLPEKPLWPEKLKKHRDYLPRLPPLPGSSRP